MSLGVCRTELLTERHDARIALCKLGLLGCDLGLLGCQRLGLLLEAGFLLGDELLETIELGGIGSGSDLRNGSRKAGLGLLGRELRAVSRAFASAASRAMTASLARCSAACARSSACFSWFLRSLISCSEAPEPEPVTGIPPLPESYDACMQSRARVMTAALVMFSREAKSSIIDMYSRGKRKFACLTFELNSTT